jgi:hypothetical protein
VDLGEAVRARRLRARGERLKIKLNARHAAGPEVYLCPAPSPQRDPAFLIADATKVNDLNRLRLGLAQMAWCKILFKGREKIYQLAELLVEPVRHARVGAPPIAPKVRKQHARQRAPGAGRKPATARGVLAGDVRRAMEVIGLPNGAWHNGGSQGASPALQVLRLCWFIASGKDVARKADLRRMMTAGWHIVTSREPTADERRHYLDL